MIISSSLDQSDKIIARNWFTPFPALCACGMCVSVRLFGKSFRIIPWIICTVVVRLFGKSWIKPAFFSPTRSVSESERNGWLSHWISFFFCLQLSQVWFKDLGWGDFDETSRTTLKMKDVVCSLRCWRLFVWMTEWFALSFFFIWSYYTLDDISIVSRQVWNEMKLSASCFVPWILARNAREREKENNSKKWKTIELLSIGHIFWQRMDSKSLSTIEYPSWSNII